MGGGGQSQGPGACFPHAPPTLKEGAESLNFSRHVVYALYILI